jgi:histidinol-phosphate aminotransferase
MEDKKQETIFYKMVRPEVRGLEAYDAGPMPPARVRISANENNLGVSPKAREAMANELVRGNRYPDSSCTELREKIAKKHGLLPEQVIVGNGLDGVFTMLGRTFLSHDDEVVSGELTFSVYSDTALVMGASPVVVPMNNKMELDVDGYIKAFSTKTKMVCFCNPNNPTGSVANIQQIRRMLDAAPGSALFILDEAYMEFVDDPQPTGLSLLKEYPNLMVCRTFSKIFGLAGLRVGWTAAQPELINYMYKVREPYCVNTIAEAGALAALDDTDFVERSRTLVKSERARLCRFFDENGIRSLPSQVNFILVSFGDKTETVSKALAADGILTRMLPFRGEKLLRISVGLPEENTIVMDSLKKLL